MEAVPDARNSTTAKGDQKAKEEAMGTNGSKPMMQITCVKCQTVFSVLLPTMELLNGLFMSGVMAPHRNLMRCTKCGEPYLMAMTGAQVNWGAMPATPEMVRQVEGSPIIQPGLLVPKL